MKIAVIISSIDAIEGPGVWQEFKEGHFHLALHYQAQMAFEPQHVAAEHVADGLTNRVH